MRRLEEAGVVLERVEIVALEALVALYEAVGWSVYARTPQALLRAIEGSHHVVIATRHDVLVGLARCVSDGETIAYIQDILVAPDCQRMGIGRALVEDCLARYEDVRQKVLLTDDRPEQLAFYASLGFSNTRTLSSTPLNAFVRIEGVSLS